MNHGATVACCPAGAVRHLLADETVFHAQDVVGEGGFVEEVPEPFFECAAVAVVAHFDEPVLCPEGVGEIFAGGVPFDFRDPPVEVFAVEERDPAVIRKGGCGECARAKESN